MDNAAVHLLDYQIPELVRRVQAGGGGQIELHHLAFGVANSGDHVVGTERGRYVGRIEAIGGQFRRVQPCPQCEVSLTQ